MKVVKQIVDEIEFMVCADCGSRWTVGGSEWHNKECWNSEETPKVDGEQMTRKARGRKREFLDVLEKATETCRNRGKDYTVSGRDGSTVHGQLLEIIFPEGMSLSSSSSEKFVVWNYILGKLVRYGLLLENGGHEDSAMDICVYGAILAAQHEEPQS